jgi:hypothetical protein
MVFKHIHEIEMQSKLQFQLCLGFLETEKESLRLVPWGRRYSICARDPFVRISCSSLFPSPPHANKWFYSYLVINSHN